MTIDMEKYKDQSDPLIENNASESSESRASLKIEPHTVKRRTPWRTACLTTCFLLSLLVNGVLALILFRSQHSVRLTPELSNGRFCVQPYDQPLVDEEHSLGPSVPTTLVVGTEWSKDSAAADALWEGISMDAMTVAIDDEWARQHNVEIAASRFPWDRSKAFYTVNGFHQLHCVKNVRKALADFYKTGETSLNKHHILHCMELLRQDVMCMADSTLAPNSGPAIAIRNGTTKMCNNWDALEAWALAPERNSCFHMIDPYKIYTHGIEAFAFCKEDSQNYGPMKDYFEKHGHKDPYGP